MTADLVTFLKKCLVENFFFCAIKSLRFKAFLHVIYNHLNQLAFIKLTGKKTKSNIIILSWDLRNSLANFFFFIFFIWCGWHIALQILQHIKLRTNSNVNLLIKITPLVLNMSLICSAFNCLVFAFNLSWEILLFSPWPPFSGI